MFGGQNKDLEEEKEMKMEDILKDGKINLNLENFIISQPDITAM